MYSIQKSDKNSIKFFLSTWIRSEVKVNMTKPCIRCSLRNSLSFSCSLAFSGYTLQSFNIALGISLMA